ncbi:MAG: glycosyltransferase family 4 protein [Fibrobacterota bacterium]|nr:glycosyltransferase family 4 protein [Fibrobacterota bacterium]QQS03694.1 MAG: glycosyltransferase family 4 protein [Fibrobacterota bacterium]
MRVLLDGQIFEMQRIGGISKYFCELISGSKSQSDVEFLLPVAHSKNIHLSALNRFKDVFNSGPCAYKKFLVPFRFPGKGFLYRSYLRFWEARKGNKSVFQRALREKNYDVFHPTYYGGWSDLSQLECPVVVTVHDMIHELLPEFVPDDGTSDQKRKAVMAAKLIIAISESTKVDLVRLWGVSPDKVTVVHHGSNFKERSTLDLTLDGLPAKFILFVGERRGYKNFWIFARAISDLMESDPDLNLVVVGRPFDSAEQIELRALCYHPRILHFQPSDAQLAGVYGKATCFVFPSLYEGFGFPILEAMSNGCPVAMSSTSSFPEVGGEAAIYFDPTNSLEIQGAVQRLLVDEDLRLRLIQLGLERVKLFTWEKAVKETVAVYEMAVRGA